MTRKWKADIIEEKVASICRWMHEKQEAVKAEMFEGDHSYLGEHDKAVSYTIEISGRFQQDFVENEVVDQEKLDSLKEEHKVKTLKRLESIIEDNMLKAFQKGDDEGDDGRFLEVRVRIRKRGIL